MQNHFSKPGYLMLQSATPLRKSAPWLPNGPNVSDEHVSCTAPAARNTSLHILLKCPTSAIVFGHATKALTFCSLLTRCTNPCACHAKPHLNLQKWWGGVVFVTCWLWNVPRATTACTCSTSQLPKVVRSWCALHILTWKRASRHNGVHIFNISTSKNDPNPSVFLHVWLRSVVFAPNPSVFDTFDFQMCVVHLRATTACTFWTS